ncbi:MAG: hypothetical protein RR382_00555 [Tannerellaceae bacterium]
MSHRLSTDNILSHYSSTSAGKLDISPKQYVWVQVNYTLGDVTRTLYVQIDKLYTALEDEDDYDNYIRDIVETLGGADAHPTYAVIDSDGYKDLNTAIRWCSYASKSEFTAIDKDGNVTKYKFKHDPTHLARLNKLIEWSECDNHTTERMYMLPYKSRRILLTNYEGRTCISEVKEEYNYMRVMCQNCRACMAAPRDVIYIDTLQKLELRDDNTIDLHYKRKDGDTRKYHIELSTTDPDKLNELRKIFTDDK